MLKNTLLFIFLAISVSVYGQKVRIDSTFYEGSEVLTESNSGYTSVEVCEVDRRGRKIGNCTRYSQNGQLLEISSFEKEIQTGPYFLYSNEGIPELEGSFSNGKKDGVWVNFDDEGEPKEITVYSMDNEVSSRELEIIDPLEAKDSEGNPLVDSLPSFEGGQLGWLNHLNYTLRYPREAKRMGHQGDVFVKFVITKEGYVIAPALVRSPARSLGYEAMRVVSLSPDWIPAKSRGQEVDTFLQLRIAFALR